MGWRRVSRGLPLAIPLWIIAIAAAVLLLRESGPLMIPIVLSILISYALEPVVAWLCRHHIPRVAGAGLLLLTLTGVVGWGIYSLRDDAAEAFEALPNAARQAREMIWANPESGPRARIQEAVEELQAPPAQNGSQGQAQQQQQPPPPPLPAAGSGLTSLAQWVRLGITSAFSLAGHLVVIFFLVYFLLIAGDHFSHRITEMAGADAERRETISRIIAEINAQIQRFLLVHLVTGSIVAAATWASLATFGVNQAAVWGILAGLFNTIPYFGPVVVSGGLLLVGLLQTGDLTTALEISAAALAITSLEGWLITPPLMGRAERMHAVVVFVGVLLWTWIWGGWGTILAVPMLVVVKAVADHVDALKPVSRLMSS